MDQAYRMLIGHQPVPRGRYWSRLLRRPRCAACGGRYPCGAQRAALDDLAPPVPPRAAAAWAAWETAALPAAGLLTHGQARRYRTGGPR